MKQNIAQITQTPTVRDPDFLKVILGDCFSGPIGPLSQANSCIPVFLKGCHQLVSQHFQQTLLSLKDMKHLKRRKQPTRKQLCQDYSPKACFSVPLRMIYFQFVKGNIERSHLKTSISIIFAALKKKILPNVDKSQKKLVQVCNSASSKQQTCYSHFQT